MRIGQALKDRRDLGVRLLQGRAVLEQGQNLEPVVVASMEETLSLVEGRVLHQRHVYVRIPQRGMAAEALRRDTYYGVRLPAHVHSGAQHIRIPSPPLLPEVVAQDSHRMRIGILILLGEECPALERLHTQHVEVVGRHEESEGPHSGVPPAEREHLVLVSSYLLQGSGLVPKIEHVRIGEAAETGSVPARSDFHYPAGIGNAAHPTENEPVHTAEDDGADTDTDR